MSDSKMKNYAFIDSQNLNLGILNQGWKLDWQRLRVYLQEKYHVHTAYLFLGFVPVNKKLYDFLKDCGYQLIFKPVVTIKGQKIKGNVDAELVLQSAAVDFNIYDKAILVTGDGDFYCLVRYLLKYNKLERIIVPNKFYYSVLLRRAVGPIGYLSFFNDLKKLLEYKSSTNESGAFGGST